MQENLFEHFKNKGHSGFLRNVSITLTDMADGKDLGQYFSNMTYISLYLLYYVFPYY